MSFLNIGAVMNNYFLVLPKSKNVHPLLIKFFTSSGRQTISNANTRDSIRHLDRHKRSNKAQKMCMPTHIRVTRIIIVNSQKL